jgi:GxxExxY protein
MDTNVEKLLFKDEVFQIIGCAIEVLNTLGHGIVEKPYENALVVEFGLRQIPFRQQPAFDVLYKGQKVGTFVPDLIAFNSLIVDTKVIDWITDHGRGLMLNYLRITNLRVGVIFNFRQRKLEWERSSYGFVSIRVHSWLLTP